MKMHYNMQVTLKYPEDATPKQLDCASEAHIELMCVVYTKLLESGEKATEGTLYLYNTDDYWWSSKLLKQECYATVNYKINCLVTKEI